MCVNSTKMFLLIAGHLWLHLDLAMWSLLLVAPVGELWICSLVLSTGVLSGVVWLGWGVGIYGVRL